MVSEDLLDVLERTWRAVCREYEASAELPDMQALFDSADLAKPAQASQIVVANMLMEVMECLGRFSPCYKMPGRAFGLITMRENVTNRLCRTLAPEAVQRWDRLIHPLAGVVVTGSWSGGYTGKASCTINALGQCSLATESTPPGKTSATFTVTNATLSGYTYQAAANHDPDSDSNGTAITVNRPY